MATTMICTRTDIEYCGPVALAPRPPDLTYQPQPQSPLLSLPGEIRNQIAFQCLTTSKPITNPVITPRPSEHPAHKSVPLLGTALLRTCKQLNLETDSGPLYIANEFRFTRLAHIYAFHTSLPNTARRLATAVTIDLREVQDVPAPMYTYQDYAPSDPVELEWRHYLTCSHLAHQPGVWCSQLSTLRADVPTVRALRIDIGGWVYWKHGKDDGMKRLRSLVGKVRGLERIEITGHGKDLWEGPALNMALLPWMTGVVYSPDKWRKEVSDILVPVLARAVTEPRNFHEVKQVGWCWGDKQFSLIVELISLNDRQSRHVCASADRQTCGRETWQSEDNAD